MTALKHAQRGKALQAGRVVQQPLVLKRKRQGGTTAIGAEEKEAGGTTAIGAEMFHRDGTVHACVHHVHIYDIYMYRRT